MRAAPRTSSSSRRLSRVSSRRRWLCSRLEARLAIAVASRRCSCENGAEAPPPSSTTQPAMRPASVALPENQSGAHSTDASRPPAAGGSRSMNACSVRLSLSVIAGSRCSAASPLGTRDPATTPPSGSPSSRTTAARWAGTASSRLSSRASSSDSAVAAETMASAARVRAPRIRLCRASAEMSMSLRVASSVTSRSRATVPGKSPSLAERSASRYSRRHSAMTITSPSRSARSFSTRVPLTSVPFRLRRSRTAQPSLGARARRGVARARRRAARGRTRASGRSARGRRRARSARSVRPPGTRGSRPSATSRSRSPRRGGSSRPTACRARGRRRTALIGPEVIGSNSERVAHRLAAACAPPRRVDARDRDAPRPRLVLRRTSCASGGC